MSVYVAVESGGPPFVAVTEKENAPDDVGVPLITPVLELSVSPGGSAPEEIE